MTLSARALCTLDDLKTELGISGSAEDTRLERLVRAATRQIEHFCGRGEGFHYETARADDVQGFGGPIIHAPKTPLISIGSIVWDPNDANDTVDSDLYSLDHENQGRIYRPDGWHWTASSWRYLVDTPVPRTEQRLYRVTYACGYITPAQVGANGIFPPATVTITRAGTTATVAHTGHGLRTDNRVTISGATPTAYNDRWEITYVDDDSYTFNVGGSPTSPATGTITATIVASVPGDLEDACLQLAGAGYRRQPYDPNLASEKIGAWGASYRGGDAPAMPGGVASMLKPFQRVL